MKGNLDSHKNTSVSVGSQGGVPKGTRLEIDSRVSDDAGPWKLLLPL